MVDQGSANCTRGSGLLAGDMQGACQRRRLLGYKRWQGRRLSKARLSSPTLNKVRSLRSRTCQPTAPVLAASVISRTSAIRSATSLSEIRGLLGRFFIGGDIKRTRNKRKKTPNTKLRQIAPERSAVEQDCDQGYAADANAASPRSREPVDIGEMTEAESTVQCGLGGGSRSTRDNPEVYQWLLQQ
jgi:hypothetical protein